MVLLGKHILFLVEILESCVHIYVSECWRISKTYSLRALKWGQRLSPYSIKYLASIYPRKKCLPNKLILKMTEIVWTCMKNYLYHWNSYLFYTYWGQFDLIFKLALILLWPRNTPEGNGNVNSNVVWSFYRNTFTMISLYILPNTYFNFRRLVYFTF